MKAKALALCVGLSTMSAVAYASSHREAPAVAYDPAADDTDLYAWRSADGTKVYLIGNWIPLQAPNGGPNYHRPSDEVRYEFWITRGTSLQPVVSYYFYFTQSPYPYLDPGDTTTAANRGPGGGKTFFDQISLSTQTYKVVRTDYGPNGNPTRPPEIIARDIPVAPVNYGPRTFAVWKALGIVPGLGTTPSDSYDNAFAAQYIRPMGFQGREGRVFVGPRDDGFYVDLGGVFDLANLRPAGQAVDGVAGTNVHAFAMEIPIERLTFNGMAPAPGPSNQNTLGIYIASSRRKVQVLPNVQGEGRSYGPWTQVSRLGIPLINEAVIGLQDKDKYNRTEPKDDVANFGAYFLNPPIVRDAAAVGIYGAGAPPPDQFIRDRFDIIDVISLTNIPSMGAHSIPLSGVGDVLRLDLGVPSGFPNGRPLNPGQNTEQADVTDVELSLLLLGADSLAMNPLPVRDGVNYNDKTFLNEFPFLALPWEGFSEGLGKTTP
jgi:hypothetical protein